MNRLQVYTIAFVATLIIYALTKLLFSIDLFESITAYIFIIATLMFVFAREEKVQHENLLEQPAIHYYHKSQNNYYGYIMATGAASTAFLFYIASTRQNLPLGLITLAFWLGMILLSHFVSKYYDTNFATELIFDYIIHTLKKDVDKTKLKQAIRKMLEKKVAGKKSAKKILKDYKFDKDTSEKIADLFLEYVDEVENIKLTSEELKTIQEK